jgi:RNA polymerase sigma factor for flagellar operon FliA
VSSESLLVDNLPLIEGVIRLLCRRNGLSLGEADDFASAARLKLVENDYEVLRKYEGRATLRTYLTVVLQRVLLDLRTARWGKWRPSSEARRRGPVGMLLEQLVTRDGLTLDEAIEVLTTNHRVSESPDALREMAATFPARTSRREESDDLLVHMPDDAPAPDAGALHADLRPTATRAHAAIEKAIRSLDAQDRLIIKLRFHDGVGVADIARALHLDQKPLYRRLDQLLGRLRRALEEDGVGEREAGALLHEAWSDLVEPKAG